jgi:hypothetical protein
MLDTAIIGRNKSQYQTMIIKQRNLANSEVASNTPMASTVYAKANRINADDRFLTRSHLGGAGMSSHDPPTVVKLLKVHGGIAHHLLL